MSMNAKRCGQIVLLALSLTSCVSDQARQPLDPTVARVANSDLPEPSSADFRPSVTAFVVGPFDIITVSVFGNPELNLEEVQVDASGRIAFPFIGELGVAGKSTAEIGSEIATLLKQRFIRDPQVTVNLKETASQVVAISGEVKRPGIYPIVGEMSLMKAVARAEGWTEFSKKKEIMIFRTVGGKKYAAVYNAQSIEKGLYSDPLVFANDTIVVGDSQAKRNFKNIITAAPPLLAPLIFLLDSN